MSQTVELQCFIRRPFQMLVLLVSSPIMEAAKERLQNKRYEDDKSTSDIREVEAE
jgi:hypothetical protein